MIMAIASSQRIDVLDLASSRPAHRRTQSKSSILKALISPVKQQRKQDATGIQQSSNETRPSRTFEDISPVKYTANARTTKVSLRPSDDCEMPSTPSKPMKENIDPFVVDHKSTGPILADLSSRIPTLKRQTGRVKAAVAALQGRQASPDKDNRQDMVLDEITVNTDFEAMLDARHVPSHMREKMRNLTLRMKADLVRQEQHPSPRKSRLSEDSEPSNVEDESEELSKSTKRSRPRSRTFTFSRSERLADTSPTKKRRGRSKSRTEADSALIERSSSKPRASSRSATARAEVPETHISYLKSQPDPTMVEVGRLHKLRLLLRNEAVSWVDDFIAQEGMLLINQLLLNVLKIEWREEHEDQLLHETLLCLKGLCTTDSGIVELEKYADVLLSSLVGMLFDEERKGPAEYTTRMIIINILFSYLACKADASGDELQSRAANVLAYLNHEQKGEAQPHDFVQHMHTSRPYQDWAREVSNVTREVFWIFLHSLNIIPLERPSSSSSTRGKTISFVKKHFPGARPPVPAAPYVGGVEWDAAMYLTAHLDLLNGLIAAMPTQAARNDLRRQLQLSGFEKTMGATLRTCKEKFYAGIHDGLRAWVRAATEDGWPTIYVREGPTLEEQAKSARASPQKSGKKQAPPPKLDSVKLECPAFDLDVGNLMSSDITNDDWIG